MATLITEYCILCGACEAECPNEAISEGEEVYEVDFNLCTECIGFYDHRRCMLVCPVAALIFDPDQQESKEELRSKYRRLYPDRQPTGGWD